MEAAYDEVEILQRVTRYANKPEWIESLKEYYKDVEYLEALVKLSRKEKLNSLGMIVMLSSC